MFATYVLVYDPTEVNRRLKSKGLLGESLTDISIIRQGIDKLNGESICQLFIGERSPTDDSTLPWDGRGMEISGGNERFYCEVVEELNDYERHWVFDPSVPGANEWTDIRRGQSTSVLRGSLLGKSNAISIAEEFAISGKLHSSFSWRSE